LTITSPSGTVELFPKGHEIGNLLLTNSLAGCGALKELDPQHAEIKSMRMASSHRRKGVAKQLLQHMLDEAKHRGYTRVSLETGSMDFFLPARALYASFGFEHCPPFADYIEDPNSVFMTKEL
jgi:putative acetyltransferase